MQIETLSPAHQKRVLRFMQDLAQVFRRIQAEAEARTQNPQTAESGDRHESQK